MEERRESYILGALYYITDRPIHYIDSLYCVAVYIAVWIDNVRYGTEQSSRLVFHSHNYGFVR